MSEHSKTWAVKSRRSQGVVAGKFMPFHNGHRDLLLHALKQAEFISVLLVVKDDDPIDPTSRALSIYEEMRGMNIRIFIVDDIYTDDDTAESHILWARYTKEILGFTPQVVVASEEYGKGWAAAMGCDFEMYDVDRFKVPVSGTLVRENVYKQSQYLPMATKRYMLPRIVVMGAESTGTSTLANALAAHYQTRVVPELGRLLAEEEIAAGGTNDDSTWTNDRFWLTSRGQDASEERLARQANGLLICDTDSLATAAWYQYYMKKKTPGFTAWDSSRFFRAGLKQSRKHALYIVTSPVGVDFEDDGTRTGEDLRFWHHERFVENAEAAYQTNLVPYYIAVGNPEQRLTEAIKMIDKVVGND